jgi:hypothetical protein
MNIRLVQHLWLAHNPERIDLVLLLSIGYLWNQLDHKKIFKNDSMQDMKWCVRHDGSWKKINKDLATMNYATTIFQILDVPVFLASSQWVVFGGQV